MYQNPDRPQRDLSYKPVGTTPPIFVPRSGDAPAVVEPGANYFYVKIAAAQAAFTGPVWEDVQRLIVTSKVALNHKQLDEEARAIQRSREVKRHRAEHLGLSPNLVNVVPATMTHVSLAVAFILDKKNRLVDLGGLINSDAFVAAVSLAPGAAMVAKTIGGLSDKLIQTFLSPTEREAILDFAGAFNIPGAELQDGYYAILGTRDPDNPLPTGTPQLSVGNNELLLDGQPITQLSYVVLEVRVIPARTRSLNDGAVWNEKLHAAELEAQQIASDYKPSMTTRKQAWNKCRELVYEAQLLMFADPNYLRAEADAIALGVLEQCRRDIFGAETGHRLSGGSDAVEKALEPAELSLLGMDPDTNVPETLGRYAEQVMAARAILAADGLS